MDRLQPWPCLEQDHPINKNQEEFSHLPRFPDNASIPSYTPRRHEGPSVDYRDCVASRQSAKVIRLEIIRYYSSVDYLYGLGPKRSLEQEKRPA